MLYVSITCQHKIIALYYYIITNTYTFHTITFIVLLRARLLASSLKNYKKRHKSLRSPTELLFWRRNNEWNESTITIFNGTWEKCKRRGSCGYKQMKLFLFSSWMYFICFMIVLLRTFCLENCLVNCIQHSVVKVNKNDEENCSRFKKTFSPL